MSSIVYLKNKTNGKTYAYLNESTWDSENKRCRCKRKCLGHVDPITGEIVPNKGNVVRESARVKSVGAFFLLESISESIGLTEALKESMPDDWELFQSCIFYIMISNGPLSDMTFWTSDNEMPYREAVSNQRITDMLDNLDMNTQFRFFREWRDRFHKDEFCTLYVSSETSYDRKTETIRFNDLPLVYIEQKTDIAVTFDSETMVPISYQTIDSAPRTYTDLRRVQANESWLDYTKLTRILDGSYYSEENFNDLLRLNERFIMQVPMDSKLAKDSVNRVKDRMMDLQYSMDINGENFFAMSFLHYFEGRKCYMHIYFSTEDAEKEFVLFLDLIKDCKNEIKKGVYVPEHKAFYDKYLIVRNHSYGVEVEENGEAIMSYNTVAGFVVLVSNTVKNPKEALEQYMMRMRIQKNFENLKNEKDRRKLNLANDKLYENRLFLQFCATILYREINRVIKKHSIIRDMSFSDIMKEMRNFKRISIPGFDTPFYTNINNTQSKIIKAFDLNLKELK